jgi:hypothetical protein
MAVKLCAHIRTRAIRAILFALAMLLAWALGAETAMGSMIVSYSAAGNTLPADPPFRYVDTSGLFGSAVTPTAAGGMATLGPTSAPGRSFWYTDVLTLNHLPGFEISADLRVDSESSSNPTTDTGLAIALTDDRDLYQNLFFTPTSVYFSKLNNAGTAEIVDDSFSLDTTQFHTYTIDVENNSVTLSIDGTPELTSQLFNLAATGQLVLPDTAEIGDIATDANSQFDLKSFSVAVPEPGFGGPMLLAIAAVVAARTLRPRGSIVGT